MSVVCRQGGVRDQVNANLALRLADYDPLSCPPHDETLADQSPAYIDCKWIASQFKDESIDDNLCRGGRKDNWYTGRIVKHSPGS